MLCSRFIFSRTLLRRSHLLIRLRDRPFQSDVKAPHKALIGGASEARHRHSDCVLELLCKVGELNPTHCALDSNKLLACVYTLVLGSYPPKSRRLSPHTDKVVQVLPKSKSLYL